MAPKKKRKGKLSKLAKMDDEERARYMQHKADMEEEARRRKHQLISSFLTLKLTKEEVFSKKNTAKLNVVWRQILREISCKEMKQQIKGTIESFHFMLQRKNKFIIFLMKAIDDADHQHRRAFQTHAETVNKFIEIGSNAMSRLQSDYEHRKNSLLEGWENEYQQISSDQERAEYHLNLIRFQIKKAVDQIKNKRELGLMTLKNDGIIDLRERLLELQKSKELEMEHYWNQLRHVYSDYVKQHSPVLSHYDSLTEKDNFYKKEIKRNQKIINKMAKSVKRLQSEYATVINQNDHIIKQNAEEKEYLNQEYIRVKIKIQQDSEDDKECLAFMVEASQKAIERLQEAKEKQEKILQLHKICSKLETKIGLQNCLSKNVKIDTSNSDFDAQVLTDDIKDEIHDMEKMDNFFHKLQRSKYECDQLRREKVKLKRACEEIKKSLREKLTELALGNGFADTNKRPKTVGCYHNGQVEHIRWNRPVTCIEAVHSNAVLHEKRMKLFQLKNRENTITAIASWKNLK